MKKYVFFQLKEVPHQWYVITEVSEISPNAHMDCDLKGRALGGWNLREPDEENLHRNYFTRKNWDISEYDTLEELMESHWGDIL